MSDSRPQTTYDDVPYPSKPYRQTHPDRLEVIAALCGMTPAPAARCRVLEVGCAGGGNLIPMALALPGSEFVGVDLARAHVEEGKARAAALGLENVELVHADLSELDDAYGEFDYILAHGVYSWVPRPIQERLLGILRERLAPNGVGYVSYNTFPGWRMRSMIRDVMLFHTAPFPAPETKIKQARALLAYLAGQASGEHDPHRLLLRRELRLLESAGDSYLFHEHLEEHNEPLYLFQFLERVEAAGLRFMSEASFVDLTDYLFPERASEGLSRGSEQFLRIEQYRDFVLNRQFRCSLLVRREVALEHRPTWRDLVGTQVGSLAHPISGPVVARPGDGGPSAAEASADAACPVDLGVGVQAHFETFTGVGVSTELPLSKAALLVLSEAWPQTVPFEQLWVEARARLGAAAPAEDVARAELGAELIDLFAQNHVELRRRPLALATHPGDLPLASPLARLQADEGREQVTTLRHDAIELANLDRQVLRLLDGTRDRATVCAGLVAAAREGALDVRDDGEVMSDPEALTGVFAGLIEQKLAELAARGLLLPAPRGG